MNDLITYAIRARAAERRLIPDLALGGVPPIKLLQTNSPQLARHARDQRQPVPQGRDGRRVRRPGPRRARLPARLLRGSTTGSSAFDHRLCRIRSAGGRVASAGRRAARRKAEGCAVAAKTLRQEGLSRATTATCVQEHIGALMKIEETDQIGVYVFSKTALRIGRELANAAQRLQVDGLDGVKGGVLGRFRMTSRWRRRATAAGSCRSGHSSASSASQTARRSPPCSSSPKCARPSRRACRRRWRSKDRRRRRRRRRSKDRSTGRRRRRRMTATRMTTSTTSTSAPEETASANGAWNR